MFATVLKATLGCLVNQVRNSCVLILNDAHHSDIAVCIDPCINGGTCTEPDVCQCPEPYGGVTCADSMSIKLLLMDPVISY